MNLQSKTSFVDPIPQGVVTQPFRPVASKFVRRPCTLIMWIESKSTSNSSPRSCQLTTVSIDADRRKLKSVFDKLAYDWQSSTAGLSSTTERMEHWAYGEIIKLGSDVIPFIIERLKQPHSRLWFDVLAEITHEDPISESAYGDVPAMAEAWIQWFEDKMRTTTTVR